MKNEYTVAKKVVVRKVRGKIDSVESSIEKCDFEAWEIVKIAKENKAFYCIDLPHDEIKVVITEKYPCVFEDIKGVRTTKIITQDNIYIFS